MSSSVISGQSMFNRWIGSDPFTGSSKSTAMGNSHLLNSTGSSNARFNPANLITENSTLKFDMQLDRTSIFERWSMPVRDSFDDVLVNADYVSNEFSHFGFRGGFSASINIFKLGKVGIGFHSAPLSHFKYQYIEEVRGTNQIEDGEYESKDPIVGYHNLKTSGVLQVSSIGAGFGINFFKHLKINFGMSVNNIHESSISDVVKIDTLFSDVTNLSSLPDVDQKSIISKSNFITISAICKLNPNMTMTVSWEDSAISKSPDFTWSIDQENGLFQYWHDGNYAINGYDYLKPAIYGFGISFDSNREAPMSINFELNQISYHNHLNLNDYRIFKFGFEYVTQMGTPIRGGLTYRTSIINAFDPISIFTFGSGKNIGNVTLDMAGTYSLQSFNYPDLFPVENDVRIEYDVIRDSQLHLSLSLSYQF